MPRYSYKVRDVNGKVIRGHMLATDARELRKKLDERNYFLVEFSAPELSKGMSILEINVFTPKVKNKELSVMCWQLYTMLDAGLTLPNALTIIEQQVQNITLKAAVNKIRRRLEEGSSFSEALREHPRIFSRFFVQMVSAGEVGGVLDDIIQKLAVYFENQDEIRNKVQSALTYPCLLLTASVAVAIFLITFILPKFTVVFEDIGADIPLITQVLLQIGEFLKANGLFAFALAAGSFVFYWVYSRTGAGRYQADQFMLTLPVLGDLQRKVAAAQFSQTLASLISGGIPILTALQVVSETIDNKVVVKAIKEVATRVGEGKSIANPLEEIGIFPDMVVSMIRAGEETGALDKMLTKIAFFYEREINQLTETFTKLLEPILIVFMTVMIGSIGVSIFLPMTDLMEALHK